MDSRAPPDALFDEEVGVVSGITLTGDYFFPFLMLGCHIDEETRREAARGEERTGHYHTKSCRSNISNTTTTRKAGLYKQTGKKLLWSLFLCFFFNLKSWTVEGEGIV